MKIFKLYTLKNILKIFIFLVTLAILLCFAKSNFESVKSSTTLFLNSIIPSLFPFIFFTELILNSDIIDILSYYFGKFTKKILKLHPNCTPAIIIGFLCGYPMGSKTVATLYENNKISRNDANKLLTFVNNCNPVFILSTIGISIFNNINIGIILMISHYISAVIIAIFSTRFNINSSNIIHKNLDISKSSTKNNTNLKKEATSFFDIIKSSILKSFLTLGNIFGFIIIFNLISSIIKGFLLKLNIKNIYISIISGIFEVTKGCNEVSLVNINNNTKICIISFLLGFSGLCILSQVYSTISAQKFSFKKLIIAKTSQGFISLISTYIILNIFNFSFNKELEVFKNIDTSITYSEFLNNIKHTYINSIFLIIASLCIFSIFYTIFHKDKRAK